MKKFKFLKFLALFLALMVAIFLILDQIYPLNLDALKKDEAKILLDKNGEITIKYADIKVKDFLIIFDAGPGHVVKVKSSEIEK